MIKQRKHVLEFFKNDPWQVRMGVLALRMFFMLALALIASGATEGLPLIALRLVGMR